MSSGKSGGGDDAEVLVEAGGDEPSGGSIAPGDELEAALREASQAVSKPEHGPPSADPETSPDKLTIELLSGELQALKAEYESTKAELEDKADQHLRLQAEFENFRRRGLKERQETLNYGHQNLVKDLLSTVDNLDRAIAHSDQSDGGDLEGLLQGVDLVRRELLGALGKHGVSVIDAEEQPFDPALHEAMSQVPDGSFAPNTVVEVLQTGYQLRDRLLRPARVVVSRAPDEEKPAAEDEE